MKKPLHDDQNLVARLAGYATAAGAIIALAPNVNGQVVYSGIQNIQLSMPEENFQLDMNDDGVDDFIFMIYGYSETNTYINSDDTLYVWNAIGNADIINARTDTYKNSWIYRSTYVTWVSHTISSSIITYYGTYPMVNGLAADVQVGSTVSMWKNPSYLAYSGMLGYGKLVSSWGYTSGYDSSGYGDFFGRERYIGVRFWIGANQHYGWIRASLGDYIDPMTIIDWAYESTPGDSIITGVGDIIGPEAVLDAGVTTTEDQTVNVSLSFEERAYDFELSDLDITNGVASNLVEVDPGKEYTFDVTAMADGQVTVELPVGSVTDFIGNENLLASESWIYDEPIAVELNSAEGITIYPNPVDNILTIKLEKLSEIKIVDLNGRMVHQQKDVLDLSLDVSSYNPGVYIVQISNNKAVTQHKIIVK